MGSAAPVNFGSPWVLKDFVPELQHSLLPADSPPLCGSCKAPGAQQRCAGCKDMHYCSKDCQATNWSTHKLVCKAFNDAGSEARPGINYRRALLFTPSSSRPKFIWLEFPNGMDYPFGITAYFPTGEVSQIDFQDRNLPYSVQISYNANGFGTRFLPNNKGIQKLIGAENAGRYRGTFIVLAYATGHGIEDAAKDVDTGVLGPLAEYFKLRAGYKGPVFAEQPQKWYAEEEWREFMAPMLRDMQQASAGQAML